MFVIFEFMKAHNGMRPQDIVILLKIISLKSSAWYNKELAAQLNISNSEVSESLHRSVIGELLQEDKKTVRKEALLEFLVYGLRYVFPATPGSLVRGMPTAYSAPLLDNQFVVDAPYVWRARGYRTKGVAITPLYETVPQACEEDSVLYDLLTLVDALRIGRRKDEIVQLLADKMKVSGSKNSTLVL
jgi:hypothetical protein